MIPGIMKPELESLLIRHEGMRLKAYLDTKGIITIGVGRNLEGNGITDDEAIYLLRNDIARVAQEAADNFVWFQSLSQPRQDVICDMLFMGLARFKTFTRMLAAIEADDFTQAANEMLASMWAAEVGRRAVELAMIMKTSMY